jgi:hypothetical protein
MNLRELAVSDSKSLNIKDWGLVVQLISPSGIKYNTDNETGEILKAKQILYDYRKLDPSTGEEITVNEPVVVMARSSLAVIPKAGEKWVMKFPADPNQSETATLSEFVLSETRAPEGGRSLGDIRLYPQKVVQS